MRKIFLIILLGSSYAFGQTPLRSLLGANASTCIADADSQSFFDSAVVTNSVEKCAIIQLVQSLKDSSLWTKAKALYPFVGTDTISKKAFNLKNTAQFKITTTSTSVLIFTALGYDPVEGALQTGFIPSTHATASSLSIGYYSRTNQAGSTAQDMGVIDGVKFAVLRPKFTDNNAYAYIDGNAALAFGSSTDSRGMFLGSRTSTTSIVIYKNGVSLGSSATVTASTPAAREIVIGAVNNGGAIQFPSAKKCGFAWIGDGLNATEARQLYNIIQAFNTALGRQV